MKRLSPQVRLTEAVMQATLLIRMNLMQKRQMTMTDDSKLSTRMELPQGNRMTDSNLAEVEVLPDSKTLLPSRARCRVLKMAEVDNKTLKILTVKSIKMISTST